LVAAKKGYIFLFSWISGLSLDIIEEKYQLKDIPSVVADTV
jgi:hypothetical protein